MEPASEREPSTIQPPAWSGAGLEGGLVTRGEAAAALTVSTTVASQHLAVETASSILSPAPAAQCRRRLVSRRLGLPAVIGT
jgi:hypothetical protein